MTALEPWYPCFRQTGMRKTAGKKISHACTLAPHKHKKESQGKLPHSRQQFKPHRSTQEHQLLFLPTQGKCLYYQHLSLQPQESMILFRSSYLKAFEVFLLKGVNRQSSSAPGRTSEKTLVLSPLHKDRNVQRNGPLLHCIFYLLLYRTPMT